MLHRPQLAGSGIEDRALDVAVADREHLRPPAAGFRIVGRRRAVRHDADHLADVIGKTLRLVARAVVVAEGDEQIAVGGLRDAAAVMIARRQRPLLAEDHPGLVEPAGAVVEPGARHGGTAAA